MGNARGGEKKKSRIASQARAGGEHESTSTDSPRRGRRRIERRGGPFIRLTILFVSRGVVPVCPRPMPHPGLLRYLFTAAPQ
jgi:hypothetical protein